MAHSMQRLASASSCTSTARPVLRASPVLRLQARRSPTCVRVAQVTQDTFQAEVLQSDVPVVVDFWASWCGPCKLVAPLMDWAEKEYQGSIKVVKVEHDANPKLIEEFKVYGLPALVLIRNGELVPGSKREGAFTKAIFQEWLSKHGLTAPAKAL